MDTVSKTINKLMVAAKDGKTAVTLLHTKLADAIAEILAREGYISIIGRKNKKAQKLIDIKINYDETGPKIRGVKRVSHLSQRIYKKASEITPFKSGYGSYIISTPKGLLTDREARRMKVGGEVLFKIW